MDSINITRKYKLLIFDVDGTLYFQKKLRIIMAIRLCLHYCVRPVLFKDILALRLFRKKREAAPESGLSSFDSAIYCAVAEELGLSAEYVEGLVHRWMYEAPLRSLRRCADKRLASLILQARERSIGVVTFSDYPTKDKLSALQIEADAQFSATDSEVNALKPNPKGLHVILAATKGDARHCLMIGDRDEKDGECARRAGIDYFILPSSRHARKNALRTLERIFFS
jgi:phosphoglycolate phosphatase/putative hydrolase of the HAD superfamily